MALPVFDFFAEAMLRMTLRFASCCFFGRIDGGGAIFYLGSIRASEDVAVKRRDSPGRHHYYLIPGNSGTDSNVTSS